MIAWYRNPRILNGLLSLSCVGLLLSLLWVSIETRNNACLVLEQISQMQEARMQTLESSWVDADKVTHTVTTPKNDGESTEAHVARHQAAVNALKAIYPPVGD